MPTKNHGLLIHFDEERRKDLIQDNVENGYATFSDALSIPDWDMGEFNIALLCFSESTIDYMSLAKKGKKVVTSKSRVDFSGMLNLRSIPLHDVESRISERLQRFFVRASQGTGGIIPPATWSSMVAVIKELRPDLVEEINRILSLRRYSGFRLSGESADVLLQEREALGMALQIFTGNNQLRDRVLSEWAPYDDTITDINEDESTAKLKDPGVGRSSFLKGIPQRYLQEESALQHDLFNWSGITPMHEAGISVFEQGGRRVEVHYANRNALEKTLGVDLIYYNEIYEMFVLVQYKLMKKEGDLTLYRPDAQLHLEIERMDKIYTEIRNTSAIQSHQEFRFNDDGFMIKLVPSTGLRPASGELIKGMYISREYLHFLIGSNGPKGVMGGSQITFANAPRYLTNSQFAESVHCGWIGTRGVQSQKIREILQQFYESGRAVLFAYESSTGS